MNVREAILSAADHIERYPQEFQFSAMYAPAAPHCGTPGCAIGWIGAFLGMKGANNCTVMKAITGGSADTGPFYQELTHFTGDHWISDTALCAKALRLYAERHHPSIQAPDWEALATPTNAVLFSGSTT